MTTTIPHAVPTTSADTSPQPTNGVAKLTHWGVIRAQGPDAIQFLQGQLTNDFALLGMSEARLAAYCSPKGRMLASFVGFKVGADNVLLLCRSDILVSTLKRLSMFVMRAQCKLSDASTEYDLWGLAGAAAQTLPTANPLATWAKVDVPHPDTTTLPADEHQVSHAVGLPPATTAGPNQSILTHRALWCTPTNTPLPSALAVQPALSLDQWACLEVWSGVAMVAEALMDAFVPQMLNYESVGGINFKKGCYPGQEVVARSQYRGTIKRRTFRALCPGEVEVGQSIYTSSDAEQPCGTIVAAAQCAPCQSEVLVALQTSATESGTLHAGSVTGPQLLLQPLPYALLQDI